MPPGRPRQSPAEPQFSRTVIDSRRLMYFYHVAKAGRFTAAETILDVAQSTLSRQIQQLEADLGTQLLERTGHGVRMTAQGQILFRQAEVILQKMHATLEQLGESRSQTRDTVSVAAPPSFMLTYMIDVIGRFTAAQPDVRLCVVEAPTGAIHGLLANGDVDAAVVLDVGNNSRLRTRQLIREPLCLVTRADHPVAARNVVTPADFAGLDLVIPASQNGSRLILSRYLDTDGHPLRSQLEVDSLPLVRALIQRLGVCAILPGETCRAEVDSGAFITRPLEPPLHRTLDVATLRDHALTPTVETLIDTIVAITAEHPATC